MAFDFDEELRKAIGVAESLYGSRDMTYELKPVEYHQKNYAQSVVDTEARTVSVKLADPTPFNDRDLEAKYELWHEAVHCLSPVCRMDTLYFEEGLALRFGLKRSPIAVPQRKAYRDAIRPPWSQAYQAFTKLNPSDEMVRKIRESAEAKTFDNVTEEVIMQVCRLRENLARDLCKRLPKSTR